MDDNRILIKLTNISSHIENEEFFSLRVVFDHDANHVRYAGFYYGCDDLLELAVDRDSGMLRSILLTICNHYSIFDSCFDYGNIVPSDEEVIIRLTDHNECSVFNMDVFNNSAVIKVSETVPSKYVKCGQVLFGIDDNSNICIFIVTELNDDNVRHIAYELESQS